MEAIREFNVFIVSDSEYTMEDYISQTLACMHRFDPGVTVVAGPVVKNDYNEGVNAAFVLIESYMKNKTMLNLEEVERFKTQLQTLMK